MKKLFRVTIVLLAVIAMNACNKSAETPEAVAEKFLNHLSKKEFEEAKVYGTEATGQMIDLMASFAGMGEEEAEEIEEAKIEDIKAAIDGDSAVVTYTADGKEEKLNLVKQDGKWLVNMSKEDGMGDAIDEAEEVGEELEGAMEEEVDQPAEEVEDEVEK